MSDPIYTYVKGKGWVPTYPNSGVGVYVISEKIG